MELESFRNLSGSCPKPSGDLSGNSQESSRNHSEALAGMFTFFFLRLRMSQAVLPGSKKNYP